MIRMNKVLHLPDSTHEVGGPARCTIHRWRGDRRCGRHGHLGGWSQAPRRRLERRRVVKEAAATPTCRTILLAGRSEKLSGFPGGSIRDVRGGDPDPHVPESGRGEAPRDRDQGRLTMRQGTNPEGRAARPAFRRISSSWGGRCRPVVWPGRRGLTSERRVGSTRARSRTATSWSCAASMERRCADRPRPRRSAPLEGSAVLRLRRLRSPGW